MSCLFSGSTGSGWLYKCNVWNINSSVTGSILKWFNYPHARAHPGCEVSCHGIESTCIICSFVIRRGHSDSGESRIVLQSGLTCNLVAKFPQHSVIACSMPISCCRGRTLRTRPWKGVCKPLMPDVMAPKAHQNNRSYVSSADLPSDSLRENLAWWSVTWRTLKNHKTVKIGGWALARDNTVHSRATNVLFGGWDGLS